VLTSQSIPFLELEEPGLHRLVVEEHQAAAALEELRRYEEENRGSRLPRVLPPAAPFARTGTALLALVLAAFALAQWNSAFGLDWLGGGAALASAIRAGELQRTATALTLHAHVPHLLSNLVFGALFSYLLFHSYGAGLGTLAMLLAGMLGNWINAWIQAPEHLSIGASTAVFAAVGLLGGSEARARHLLREPEASRFAPIGGALLLMLYLGVGGGKVGADQEYLMDNVDVLAHLFGLLWGVVLGGLLGSLPRSWIERPGLQLACALGAWALLGLCWVVALA
jgi:membrane associated rhomboid family serine protease